MVVDYAFVFFLFPAEILSEGEEDREEALREMEQDKMKM